MPGSFEAVAIFAAIIVPGLLLAAGYNRTRAHSLPRLDLYALARAIALSLAWLPAVWLLGGRHVLRWSEAGTLGDHQIAILAMIWLNLLVAFVGGLIVGRIVDAIGDRPSGLPARLLDWTAAFEHPTPWDYAWSRASDAAWAAVEITTSRGETYNVLFDGGSKVGLSPNPREAFFDTEFIFSDNEEVEVHEHEGIFIEAGEIITLRFLHIEPVEEQEVDDGHVEEQVDEQAHEGGP